MMIRILISLAVLALFGLTLDNYPIVDPPHWNPSWPMYENGTYEKCWIGYGDWCVLEEGPHPGLDFDDPSNGADSVLASNDFPAFSGGVFESIDPNLGWEMCFLKFPDDAYGWGIGHLKIDNDNIWPFRCGDTLDIKEVIAVTQPTSGQHSWRHIHLSWVPKLAPPPTGEFVGLFNPFDYLQAPSGYDETSFWHIPYVDNNNHRGLWFTWDQIEEPGSFPGGQPALEAFQGRVYGQVDIVARPYSHPVGSPYETNCGVRSVSHNILRQHPYFYDYSPLSEDIYGARTLVSFDGEIPYGPSAYYRALFFDPVGVGGGTWRFGTSYIITNCGKDPIGSNGFNNIWTGPLSHDWNASPPRFNQGGWDTRLRSPSTGGSAERPKAYVNEHAAFSDGRYAIAVTAESQGNSIFSIDTLPSIDVWNPTSPIKGIVVDNYRPHVKSVVVYQCPENIVLYSAEWITDYVNPLDSIRLYDEMDDWSYLAQDTAHTLFVYVHYSEPIDSSSTGNVWLTAGNQFETIWSSMDSYVPNYSSPIPLMNSTNSGSQVVSRETDDGSFYVGYESDVPFPGRYAGELTLHISDPRDLANNRIDADPSTVAAPRGSNGHFPSTGYEAGIDSSYSWGVPKYWARPSPYNQYVVGKRYNGGPGISGTGLYLDSLLIGGHQIPCTTGPSYGENSRRGWCSYWTGFWICKDPWGVTDSIYIAKPVVGEGLYNGWDLITFDLPIPYEIYYSGPDIPYPHSQCRGCISTHTGNHCFVGWSNKENPTASYQSFITCISAISSSIARTRYLGSGRTKVIYGGAGDTVKVLHGEEILYFTPEDFFQEEKNKGDNHQACEVVEDGPGAVNNFSIAAPSPNPFAVSSVFTYTLASSGTASLDVYDISGRIVRNLVSGDHLSGTHSVTWDGDDSNGSPIPGGIYLLRLTSGGETAVRSCVVIR